MNWKEAKELAEALAPLAGDVLPADLTPPRILAIILAGQEMGLPPMLSLRSLYMVRGRIEITAQGMLAIAVKQGLIKAWGFKERSSKQATFWAERKDGLRMEASFTLQEAEELGVTGREVWRRAPADMLAAKAIARCLRLACPEIFAGVYEPGEVQAEAEETMAMTEEGLVEEETPLVIEEELAEEEAPTPEEAEEKDVKVSAFKRLRPEPPTIEEALGLTIASISSSPEGAEGGEEEGEGGVEEGYEGERLKKYPGVEILQDVSGFPLCPVHGPPIKLGDYELQGHYLFCRHDVKCTFRAELGTREEVDQARRAAFSAIAQRGHRATALRIVRTLISGDDRVELKLSAPLWLYAFALGSAARMWEWIAYVVREAKSEELLRWSMGKPPEWVIPLEVS